MRGRCALEDQRHESTRELDHLGPLFSFVHDKLAPGRARLS
jgi:hypothetical protein